MSTASPVSSRPRRPKGSVRAAELAARGTIPGYDPAITAGDCWFDETAAKRAIDFFHECLTFTCAEWQGKRFKLQDWQHAIVWHLFGWKRPDGTRRYRKAFIYVARKNGKSELVAGLGNLLVFADNEPGAQVYCAAADREQARIVFNAARKMVEAEPELLSRSKVYLNSVVVHETGSVLKVVSAEAYSKHGINAHGVIIDELHAHPTRELVDVLTSSVGSRRQPLTVFLTTADYDREGSPCNEEYDYAVKVRDNALMIPDPYYLPVIYEASRDDDWTDPAVWAKANPNLGVSIKLDNLTEEYREAQQKPTKENVFKRLHLNMRTSQANKIIPLERWDACRRDYSETDMEASQESCFGGLDISSTTDLTAFVLFFPTSGRLLEWYWIPGGNAEIRELRDRVPYVTWQRQGFLRATMGERIDQQVIEDHVVGCLGRFRVVDIAYDPWNCENLRQRLESRGAGMVPVRQGGFSYNEPTKVFETRVADEAIHHNGNPVTRMCIDNLVVKADEKDNMVPVKLNSRARADGAFAAIMALGLSMLSPLPPSDVSQLIG